MEEKSSINYFVAHEKIRNLIFEEWEKTNILLQKGPEILKQYFCKLWNEVKMECLYIDDVDVIDLDKEIKPEDFDISYSILNDGIKAFNFIMPKPIIQCGQVACVTLLITKRIPRVFTLELAKNKNGENCYSIGEWQIDFENNDYRHKNYETIDKLNIGEFLGKINKILNNG